MNGSVIEHIIRGLLLFSVFLGCGGSAEEGGIGRSHQHQESNATPTGESVTPHDGKRHHSAHRKDHDFKDAEAWSKMFDDPKRDAWQKPSVVVQELQLDKGMVVADVGAATGYFEGPLSKAVGGEGKVLALDVAPQMIEFMAARAAEDGWNNVTAKVVAPDDPELDDASVHRVLIVNTWHHIEDRVRYAQKLHRALRPGGYVLIVDFNQKSPHGPPASERIEADVVRREFESAGFDLAYPTNNELPYQYMVRAGRSDKLVTIPNAVLLGGTLFGGPPSDQDLNAIKQAGYTQVVSLRTASEPGAKEEPTAVKKRGLAFISIPVEGAEGLTETNAKALFLSLKAQPKSVVHCGSGNRAGALMGLAARCAGGTIEQALQVADHAGVTKLRPALEAKLREGVCAPKTVK